LKCRYRKAAEQGSASAQSSLGVLYASGRGVKQDFCAAAEWYRRAAAQGHPKAMSNLGVMHHNGTGVEQDFGEAAFWCGAMCFCAFDCTGRVRVDDNIEILEVFACST